MIEEKSPMSKWINDFLNVKCCENCEYNSENKYIGACKTCTLNPNYMSHFKENATITNLKKKIKEKEVR